MVVGADARLPEAREQLRDVREEMLEEARRLACSVSRLAQRAWEFARSRLRALSSSEASD